MNRRHYIPTDAKMESLQVSGMLLFTPVWNEKIDRYEVELLAPLRFDLPKRDASILISPGFTSDGRSGPPVSWPTIGAPLASRQLLIAILHDALFGAELFPRTTCDDIYLDGQVDLGVDWLTRNRSWLWLRAGSWTVWNRHTPESIAECAKLVRRVPIGYEPGFVHQFPSLERHNG